MYVELYIRIFSFDSPIENKTDLHLFLFTRIKCSKSSSARRETNGESGEELEIKILSVSLQTVLF